MKKYTPASILLLALFALGTLSLKAQGTIEAAGANVAAITEDFYKRPDRVLVAAHRAAHADYPENSLAAIREAIRLGVDIVETDVRETSDGVLVIMHDKTVDRTTNGKGPVSGFTWAELQKLQLLHKGQLTAERIPTLEDVLQLTKGRIMVDIDFKAETERAAKGICALIKKYDMAEQVLFFLYELKYASRLHAYDKDIRIMPRAYSPEDVATILQIDYIPVLHGDFSYYTDSLMQKVRDAGVRVWMNALGKYDKMEAEQPGSGYDALLQMKAINVIQTDRPKELLQYLQSRGLHR